MTKRYRSRRLPAATWVAVFIVGLACTLANSILAAEAPPIEVEEATARLSAATVTVRMHSPKALAQPRESAPTAPAAADKPPAIDVSVVSGVSLGDGLVVSFLQPLDGARFYLTLSDGGQATGELRVLDRYSGLILLEIPDDGLAGIEIADELPAAGALVLTAAASGIEAPAMSLGIISAIDRSLPGSTLPPLLQCDVRTTEASPGAPLTDRDGRLIGIVAATPDNGRNWTYGVPARFVHRLIRERVPDRRVTIERRRPFLGVKLAGGDEFAAVKVEQVEPEGPADSVGIRVDDVVVAADGRKVRSVYQVQSLVLKKQPGDVITLIVDRDGEVLSFDVTLKGGGVFDEAPRTPPAAPHEIGIVVEDAAGTSPGETLQKEDDYLRRQLAAFEIVVDGLKRQLAEREEQQRQTDALVDSLLQEIARLKAEMAALKADPPADKR